MAQPVESIHVQTTSETKNNIFVALAELEETSRTQPEAFPNDFYLVVLFDNPPSNVNDAMRSRGAIYGGNFSGSRNLMSEVPKSSSVERKINTTQENKSYHVIAVFPTAENNLENLKAWSLKVDRYCLLASPIMVKEWIRWVLFTNHATKLRDTYSKNVEFDCF